MATTNGFENLAQWSELQKNQGDSRPVRTYSAAAYYGEADSSSMTELSGSTPDTSVAGAASVTARSHPTPTRSVAGASSITPESSAGTYNDASRKPEVALKSLLVDHGFHWSQRSKQTARKACKVTKPGPKIAEGFMYHQPVAERRRGLPQPRPVTRPENPGIDDGFLLARRSQPRPLRQGAQQLPDKCVISAPRPLDDGFFLQPQPQQYPQMPPRPPQVSSSWHPAPQIHPAAGQRYYDRSHSSLQHQQGGFRDDGFFYSQFRQQEPPPKPYRP